MDEYIAAVAAAAKSAISAGHDIPTAFKLAGALFALVPVPASPAAPAAIPAAPTLVARMTPPGAIPAAEPAPPSA